MVNTPFCMYMYMYNTKHDVMMVEKLYWCLHGVLTVLFLYFVACVIFCGNIIMDLEVSLKNFICIFLDFFFQLSFSMSQIVCLKIHSNVFIVFYIYWEGPLIKFQILYENIEAILFSSGATSRRFLNPLLLPWKYKSFTYKTTSARHAYTSDHNNGQ